MKPGLDKHKTRGQNTRASSALLTPSWRPVGAPPLSGTYHSPPRRLSFKRRAPPRVKKEPRLSLPRRLSFKERWAILKVLKEPVEKPTEERKGKNDNQTGMEPVQVALSFSDLAQTSLEVATSQLQWQQRQQQQQELQQHAAASGSACGPVKTKKDATQAAVRPSSQSCSSSGDECSEPLGSLSAIPPFSKFTGDRSGGHTGKADITVGDDTTQQQGPTGSSEEVKYMFTHSPCFAELPVHITVLVQAAEVQGIPPRDVLSLLRGTPKTRRQVVAGGHVDSKQRETLEMIMHAMA